MHEYLYNVILFINLYCSSSALVFSLVTSNYTKELVKRVHGGKLFKPKDYTSFRSASSVAKFTISPFVPEAYVNSYTPGLVQP